MKVTTTTVVDDGTGAAPVAKSLWDGETISGVLIKAEDERRFSLHVAYPADKADVGKAADGHQDFASKQAVEDAAWGYMLKYRDVGLYHADGTSGAGQLVESYVYRGPDWVVKAADGSEHTIKAGDWLAGFIWSPEAWPLVRNGQVRGVSPQGRASRRTPSAAAVAALRS